MYIKCSGGTLNIFLELFTSYLFYFLIFFFQSVLTRSLHFSVLEISCCSIFNEQFFALPRSPSFYALVYYTSTEKKSQAIFLIFFELFSKTAVCTNTQESFRLFVQVSYNFYRVMNKPRQTRSFLSEYFSSVYQINDYY